MSKSFKRKPKPRILRKTYLIVCEGSSEEIYFRGMKKSEDLRNVNIKVVNPSMSTPNEIYGYTRKEYKKREYDFAFCVFDGDVLKTHTFLKGKIKEKNIQAIVSIPCFELWLLLHYRYTNKEFFDCTELISKELKKHIPDYEKSKVYQTRQSFYEKLRDSLDQAISNAKRLEEKNRENGKPQGTSTEMYKLIEKILSHNLAF